jgi:hypothetical protein
MALLRHSHTRRFSAFPASHRRPRCSIGWPSATLRFGADLWASDWNRMTPNQELRLVMKRLDANRGGIVLLHDTKRQTAAMMPAFLHELKASGYRIVHVIADAGKRSQSDHALSTKN